MRENKGKRWEKHFDDYTVIDLETCGLLGEDRNRVIEMSAIKIRGGEAIEEFSSLVNPKCLIPVRAMEITGITNAMVSGAPTVEVVLPQFLEFIGNDVIVGYNINTFDYNIIYDLTESVLKQVFSNDFVDVLYAAKKGITEIEKHNLETVCNWLNIDYTGAHRALKDCYLTKSAYDIISEKYGESAFDGNLHEVHSGSKCFKPRLTEETQRLIELQNILTCIVEDNVVSEDEVNMLVEWMDYNIQLRGNYPFDRVYNLLETVFEDGIVDAQEYRLLLNKFTEFINPTKSTSFCIGDLSNKHFVLTGEFSYGSRSSVSEYITSRGGIVDGNVIKKTQYVVIGSLGSQAWKNGVYGSKIKKAIELKDKGQNIELVAEEVFFNA